MLPPTGLRMNSTGGQFVQTAPLKGSVRCWFSVISLNPLTNKYQTSPALSFKLQDLFPGTNQFCCPRCVREKVNLGWHGLISLCDFHAAHVYITHYSITSDNRTKGVHYLETPGYDKKNSSREREIDAPEHSSSQQLTWVIINVSTDTPFKSPPIDIFDIARGIVHLLFHMSVMVQLAPANPSS